MISPHANTGITTEQIERTSTGQSPPGLLYLSKSDILRLGGDTSQLYIAAVERALRLHAGGDVVQPLKPYLRPRGENVHIADRIIAMPAYLGGPEPIAGLKWIGSKHDNRSARGLDRASALTILNDAATHYPLAIMEGSQLSGMRTAAVTAIAARHLAQPDFRSVALIGCGVIARMHVCTLAEQFPSLGTVLLFDLNPAAAEALAGEMRERFPEVEFRVAPTAKAAVRAGEVVVTCTVADRPYLPFAWLRPGTFVSNVSIMDLHKEVFLEVDKVVVDDWDQCNREKKVIHQLVTEGLFSRALLHAELGQIVLGLRPGRERRDEIILLNPMGMAIEDIACADAIYRRALAAQAGTWLSLE